MNDRLPGVRALGLDPGTKRIGVAVSDISGTVASPLCVLQRRSHAVDLEALARLVRDEEAVVVVIGLPLHMDGRESPSAKAARRLGAELAKLIDVPVDFHDERRTTAQAERDMADAGLSGPRRRQVVDKIAAGIMLQSWLDARRHRLLAGRDVAVGGVQ